MKRLLFSLILSLLMLVTPATANHNYFHPVSFNQDGGGNVVDVGDSHTWYGCGFYHYCPETWDIDGAGGRKSGEGYPVLDYMLRARHTVVAFDLGTNDRDDPALYRASLKRVWDRIGPDRDLVLVTCYAQAPPSCAPINTEIHDFASNHPGRCRVAEWAQLAGQHPEWVSPDLLHYTPYGYSVRVQLLKNTIAAVMR